jgi:beta-galactosidase
MISWELLSNGKAVDSGQFSSFILSPGEKRVLTIPVRNSGLTAGPEYFINICLKTTAPRGLLREGHLLAAEQFPLPLSEEKEAVSQTGLLEKLKVSDSGTTVSVTGAQFVIGFDKGTGVLNSWKYQDVEMIIHGPVPNFRRAPTDNDIGNGMAKRCKTWFDASEKRVVMKTVVEKVSDNDVLITVQFGFPDTIAQETVSYRIQADGKVTVSSTLKPLKEKLPELPRFGLNMAINPEFRNVEWYGRGPHENYRDRNTSAFVGRYNSTVEEQFVPYARPQENGYKTDVRWLTLESDKNIILKFTGQPWFSFSALPYTYDDMKGFSLGGKHLNDLEMNPFVDLNIDFGQMGVGGDDSWGARTHAQYTLPAGEYSYSFTMEAGLKDQMVK